MTKRTITVDGVSIQISNLDKALWPEEGITKADLMRYLTQVGPALLPQLYNRPLTVVRYPDGINAHSFYQKDAPAHTPDWIATYRVFSSGGDKHINYILANDLPTLIWLANQGALEYHPWMSRIERPDHPTYAVIDLDPTEGARFDDAREVARLTKMWLDELGLIGAPKTSGATGIHIVIPLAPVYTYEVTSRFVHLLARLMERELPNRVTTERMVKKRPAGTVYVDHLQNLPGKTIVAPYSPRPRSQAAVSAPFPWSDLDNVGPEQFHLRDPDRVLKTADMFALVMTRQQTLDAAFARLKALGTTHPS